MLILTPINFFVIHWQCINYLFVLQEKFLVSMVQRIWMFWIDLVSVALLQCLGEIWDQGRFEKHRLWHSSCCSAIGTLFYRIQTRRTSKAHIIGTSDVDWFSPVTAFPNFDSPACQSLPMCLCTCVPIIAKIWRIGNSARDKKWQGISCAVKSILSFVIWLIHISKRLHNAKLLICLLTKRQIVCSDQIKRPCQNFFNLSICFVLL